MATERGRAQALSSDDPLAMYYVVRKDHALTFGQSMSIAGVAAVQCVLSFSGDSRFRDAFAAWGERPRKVALRASGDELETLASEHAGVVVETAAARTLLCLPPRRKSERSQLLHELAPFTDAPRPKEPPPEPSGHTLVYVVRPGVIRTMGKAMAQAGHAAIGCLDRYGEEAARGPGRVRAATDAGDWERLRSDPAAVVVTDAGHTQVAPGTETVIALPPAAAVPESLERVP